jgi:serine/threonine-protein kinase
MAKDVIGKYEIIDKIGQGGMGIVYKAKHPTLKKAVVLKQLTLKNSPSVLERFKREARLMFEFRNDHIVQVFDFFKEGSSYFIAAEYVDGVSLDKLIKDNRYLPNEIAALIFLEICKGVKYAHDRGVIHRDIKPANILISKEGEVKITDFGIATSKEDEEVGLTKAGATLGSPAFMSPEQIQDASSVDKKADIYSLGILLYNMVTGKLPFPCNITPETIMRIEKGKYEVPRKINPHVNPTIQHIITKAMHRKKNNRFKDLSRVISILKRYLRRYKRENDIQYAIKSYIHGSDGVDFAKKIKKKASIPIFAPVMTIIMVFIMLGMIGLGYLFYTGKFYEIFKVNDYGLLKIAVEGDQGSGILDEKNIITRVYYKEGKNDYKILKNINISYKKNIKKSFGNIVYFESQNLYLKSGLYKFDININNERYNKYFYLNPIIKQKKELNDESGIKFIKIKYVNTNFFPLKIFYNFMDIDKNTNINDLTISIKANDRWYKWDDFLKRHWSELVTGKEYEFEFRKPGYLVERYKTYVEPYQNILRLDVKMTPVPGNLKITGNDRGFELLLNESKYYYTGGKMREYTLIQPGKLKILFNNILYIMTGKDKGKYAKIDRTIPKDYNLVLSPGEYFLTVKNGKNRKSIKAIVYPNNTITIDIDYNDKINKLDLVTK